MATITPSPTASAAFRRRGTRLNRLCERVLLNRAKFRLIKLILVVKGRGRRRRRRRFAGTERGSRLSQRFLNPCRGRVRATEHREAVTMLEDTVPTARRVFGSANPNAEGIEESLRDARAALRAREVLNASV